MQDRRNVKIKYALFGKFSSLLELKSAIYASLVFYLEDNEYIRSTPFDATLNGKDIKNKK
ncbi:hypothetical protein FACS1894201_06190 [Bacteroidia bacterium]|nr:hypothetical protein FACS1894201_06190 [Bacteroidia bacterium]